MCAGCACKGNGNPNTKWWQMDTITRQFRLPSDFFDRKVLRVPYFQLNWSLSNFLTAELKKSIELSKIGNIFPLENSLTQRKHFRNARSRQEWNTVLPSLLNALKRFCFRISASDGQSNIKLTFSPSFTIGKWWRSLERFVNVSKN